MPSSFRLLRSVAKPNCNLTLLFGLLILTRKQRLADFAFFGISSQGESKGFHSEKEIRRRCIAASWDPNRRG
ncbi:hypothetical protein CEXT_423701 [Caerostris extrusa]|uniref:Uncharacterized protein n=1 Tax=Caerostris extrusa TaxID=172846 RepID=A0AAV4PAA7_CAEEX|nr:hypothetical protein CEXT_423701 [Caerostris extrusa]